MSFVKEFVSFLMQRKKYWMIPILVILAFVAVLIVMAKGSVVAPFIYTVF